MADSARMPPENDELLSEDLAGGSTELSPKEISELVIEEKAARRARKNKLLLALFLFLLTIPLALGFLVLKTGRSDADLIREEAQRVAGNLNVNSMVEEQVKLAAKNINESVEEQINKSLSNANVNSVVLNNQLPLRIEGTLAGLQGRVHAQEQQLAGTVEVQRTLNNRIEILELPRPSTTPARDEFARNLQFEIKAAGENPTSSLNTFVEDKADAALAKRLPALAIIQRFFSDAPREGELVDYAALLERIKTLERELDKLKTGTSGSASVPADLYAEMNYEIKENSETVIYNLNLEISLGAQKDGKINRLEVKHLSEGWKHSEKNIAMGGTVSFCIKGNNYRIVPAYIARRRFAKDFIGLSIRRKPGGACTP